MKHRSILMGDIVDSSAQDPKKIQSAFGAVIGIINREYRKSILSPLTITLGDEFQGVIENLGVSFEISQRIDHLLQQKGVICRFVVGYGPIETKINHAKAWGMLGEGFTKTREALNNKKNRNRFQFAVSSDPLLQKPLNTLGFALTSTIDQWTDRQREVVHIARMGFSMKQSLKLARSSKPSYYNVLRAANYPVYEEIVETISFLLENVEQP